MNFRQAATAVFGSLLLTSFTVGCNGPKNPTIGDWDGAKIKLSENTPIPVPREPAAPKPNLGSEDGQVCSVEAKAIIAKDALGNEVFIGQQTPPLYSPQDARALATVKAAEIVADGLDGMVRVLCVPKDSVQGNTPEQELQKLLEDLLNNPGKQAPKEPFAPGKSLWLQPQSSNGVKVPSPEFLTNPTLWPQRPGLQQEIPTPAPQRS